MSAGGDAGRAPIVVVGAGAAGLVAAVFARTSGRPVVLLEKTADGGQKILISGGGRCNVLPDALEPQRFVSASSPVLVRRLLTSWSQGDQRTFFEREVGVPLTFEAETRKWFPSSNRARDVRDGLVALAGRAGASLRFGTALTRLDPSPGGWRVETTGGPIDAAAVIMAAGGLSVPKTGSDGMGFAVARAFGHVVHETYPALTPLVADPPRHAMLSGVSLDVRLRARWQGKVTDAQGGFLFTHRGYSGPAVLDLSHVARHGRPTAMIRAQWCPLDADAWLQELAPGSRLVVTAVGRHLPERLANQLLAEAGVPADRRTGDLRRPERAALIARLTSYELEWASDEGYQKAEVTGGGLALNEVHPRTLESRRCPRLFFCGELLDAFGPIGGHNFAWAWATGRLAGLAASGI